ncbi:helix-turn-helix domain-containing protein [Kitasatospora aureofaciens]|uniref:helix-turn-helix domain-containing protein n=1 Tax=Kitasatospora aureofaciens TaxID=1894 RepID=UPI0037C704E3
MGRHHTSETTSPSPADQLASELQSLKSGSGLTYARLSERTHYAKSSWERWVNGKQFPPRDAVQSIASVCGGDAERLLDLWRLADSRRITFVPLGAPAPATTAPVAGPADGGPLGDADSTCRHRREAALLRRVALVSLALGAGGMLAAAGRRPFRREA